jgi:hypothetical protein
MIVDRWLSAGKDSIMKSSGQLLDGRTLIEWLPQ